MASFNADRFKSVAAEHGDTILDDFTARTGVDQAVLSRIFRGVRKPNFDTIARLADAYGIPVDDLILRDPDPEPTEGTAA